MEIICGRWVRAGHRVPHRVILCVCVLDLFFLCTTKLDSCALIPRVFCSSHSLATHSSSSSSAARMWSMSVGGNESLLLHIGSLVSVCIDFLFHLRSKTKLIFVHL